jgi:hypothetical protein
LEVSEETANFILFKYPLLPFYIPPATVNLNVLIDCYSIDYPFTKARAVPRRALYGPGHAIWFGGGEGGGAPNPRTELDQGKKKV